jgi:OOP family OmpA-OmpF porin
MKLTASKFALVIIALSLVTLQACKSKKLVQKSPPVAETTPPPPVAKPTPPPAPVPPAPVVSKPAIDVNTVKIQFEFDSSILRTDAYTSLDQVAAVMKANPTVKYVLKGYASAEGTADHKKIIGRQGKFR